MKIGDIISGMYLIKQKLRENDKSVIYKAIHLRLKKEVILKYYKNSDDKFDKILLDREVDILKDLHHPYLAQTYDLISVEGKDCIVSEYIDGDSLYEEITKQGRLSEKDTIEIALKICNVLAYLHSRKTPIIHCDINPNNIIVSNNKDICLIDFNISLMLGKDLNHLGFTQGYSPQEQASIYNKINRMKLSDTSNISKGISIRKNHVTENLVIDKHQQSNLISHGKIDVRSDYYSLGATMFHMLSGKPADCNSYERLEFEKSLKINKKLQRIITKAMAVHKEDRFLNAESIAFELRRIAT